MTDLRDAYDSTSAADIPATAGIVMGYVWPSSFAWKPTDWSRFPKAIKVKITPSASVWGKGVHMLDVEPGDATPAQVPQWVNRSRAAGQEPTVYCSQAEGAYGWPAVIRAVDAAGIGQHPNYFVASYPGGGRVLPSVTVNGRTHTAVGHQYAGSAQTGHHYDQSVVAAFWPGVDQGADVLLTDQIVAPNGPNAGKPLADVNDTMYFTNLYAGESTTKLDVVLTQLAALKGALDADQLAVLAAIAGIPAGAAPSDAQVQAQTEQLLAKLPPAMVQALAQKLATPAG